MYFTRLTIMTMKMVLKCILVLTSVCRMLTRASLYDPHLFPDKGPFFEGWYMRVSDLSSGDSFGLLFGSVLPASEKNISAPLVLASILFRSCDEGHDICKLMSVDGEFSQEDLHITVDGKPVTENPKMSTPPDFKWLVNNNIHGGYFEQINGKTSFNFRIGNLTLRGEAKNPVYWDRYGTGPEGWLVNLPLPLHWFVYSLRSELSFYEIQNISSGSVKRGYKGAVHLEKNWGKSFPTRWIWSEGVSSGVDNASFALSGGLVDFSLLSVNAYLIGYRNPQEKISVDFRPDNSVISTKIDGCTGNVNVTASSFLYSLEINLVSKVDTLSSCLLGPESSGFVRACVESYDATAIVRITKRTIIPFGYTLVDQKTFENVALEFGGLNACNNTCSGSWLYR